MPNRIHQIVALLLVSGILLDSLAAATALMNPIYPSRITSGDMAAFQDQALMLPMSFCRRYLFEKPYRWFMGGPLWKQALTEQWQSGEDIHHFMQTLFEVGLPALIFNVSADVEYNEIASKLGRSNTIPPLPRPNDLSPADRQAIGRGLRKFWRLRGLEADYGYLGPRIAAVPTYTQTPEPLMKSAERTMDLADGGSLEERLLTQATHALALVPHIFDFALDRVVPQFIPLYLAWPDKENRNRPKSTPGLQNPSPAYMNRDWMFWMLSMMLGPRILDPKYLDMLRDLPRLDSRGNPTGEKISDVEIKALIAKVLERTEKDWRDKGFRPPLELARYMKEARPYRWEHEMPHRSYRDIELLWALPSALPTDHATSITPAAPLAAEPQTDRFASQVTNSELEPETSNPKPETFVELPAGVPIKKMEPKVAFPGTLHKSIERLFRELHVATYNRLREEDPATRLTAVIHKLVRYMDQPRPRVIKIKNILSQIDSVVLPELIKADDAMAWTLPRAGFWLANALMAFDPLPKRLPRKVRFLAHYSPEGSALFFGMLGAHLRRDFAIDDFIDIKLAPILAFGFLPELTYLMEEFQKEQEAREYASILINGLMVKLRETIRPNLSWDLKYYKRFYLTPIREATRHKQMPDLWQILIRIRTQFPDLLPITGPPANTLFAGARLGSEEIDQLIRFNRNRHLRGLPMISAWDLVNGNSSAQAYRDHAQSPISLNDLNFLNAAYRILLRYSGVEANSMPLMTVNRSS